MFGGKQLPVHSLCPLGPCKHHPVSTANTNIRKAHSNQIDTQIQPISVLESDDLKVIHLEPQAEPVGGDVCTPELANTLIVIIIIHFIYRALFKIKSNNCCVIRGLINNK